MHDAFYTTEAEEMSRAFDATNTDARSGRAGPRDAEGAAAVAAAAAAASDAAAAAALANADGLAAEPATGATAPPASDAATAGNRRVQHLVCPFCGTVNENLGVPCRQCGMENNPGTRQATRSKIGPWFVWQGRNPSAPGMNWATLMSLVEKGKVTPRSVVRGPTTGQLWRFAARVKGLSREFGLCWQCGAEIARQTRLCPGCKRIQQPPINPDALLDTVDAAGRNGPAAAAGPVSTKNRGLLSLIPEPVRRDVPPQWHQLVPDPSRLMPVAAEARDEIDENDGGVDTMAERGSAPSPHGALPVIDMGDRALPREMELRAFQLPGRDGYRDDERPIRGTFQRVVVAAIITFFVLGGVLYLHPEVRPYYVRWFRQMSNWVKPPENHEAATPGQSDDASAIGGDLLTTPAPSASPSALAAPSASAVSDHATPMPQASSADTEGPQEIELGHLATRAADPPPRQQTNVDVDVAPAGQQPERFKQSLANSRTLPDVSLSPGPTMSDRVAAAKAAGGPRAATAPAAAAAATTTPAVAAKDDAAAAAKVQISPPPSDPQTAERRAWALYERAIKSEQRSDYAAAVKEYQWIEQLRLPEGVGPSDVEARLERARKLLQARENANTN
jgi:hypothetical protein